MKKLWILFLICIFAFNVYSQDQKATLPNGKSVILHSDNTWEYYKGLSYDIEFSKLKDNVIPDFLRQGVKVKKATLKKAVEMYLQGWRFTMPRPKSTQASWSNSDGRTTWWNGHWYNKKTSKYSSSTPIRKSSGYYEGNFKNDMGTWRRGGSPSRPTKIEWLLSTSGGIRPY